MKLIIEKTHYTDTNDNFVTTYISTETYTHLENIDIKHKADESIVITVTRHGFIDKKRIFTKEIKIKPEIRGIYPNFTIESEDL